MTPERLKKLLQDYAVYLTTDQASTDDFMVEGLNFMEVIELMDHVAIAVRQYAETLRGS